MKTVFYYVFISITMLSLNLNAQTTDHPTIEKVQVMYKTVPSTASAQTSSTPVIMVQAKVNITLKPSYDAIKVFLKILDKQTNAILYSVNYDLNASPVINNNIILFKRDNNSVQITNPANIPLKPYVYELYTENAQSVKSSTYQITQ